MQQANSNLFEDDCPVNLYIESPHHEDQWLYSFDNGHDLCQLVNLPLRKQEETNANRQSKNLSLNSEKNEWKKCKEINPPLKLYSLRNKQVDEKKQPKFKLVGINSEIQRKEKQSKRSQMCARENSSKLSHNANNADELYSSRIMKSFNVGKSQKKNTNFVKFIANHFYEEFPKELYTDDQDLIQEFNTLSEVFAIDRSRQANRKWLNELFVRSQKQQIYRQFMFNLLNNRAFLNEKILKRNYMRGPNKKQYLLCSKVFKLRCKCKRLSDRVETR